MLALVYHKNAVPGGYPSTDSTKNVHGSVSHRSKTKHVAGHHHTGGTAHRHRTAEHSTERMLVRSAGIEPASGLRPLIKSQVHGHSATNAFQEVVRSEGLEPSLTG